LFGEAFGGFEILDEVDSQELLVGLGQDGLAYVVFADAELLEEGLVEQPADRWAGQSVGLAHVGSQLKGRLQVGEELGVVGLQLADGVLGSGSFPPDAGQLVVHQGVRDALLVVLVQELWFLVEELPTMSSEASYRCCQGAAPGDDAPTPGPPAVAVPTIDIAGQTH